MAKPLAPCGTFTAYKRHKRRGEPVDAACEAAMREQKNERTAAARKAANEVVRLAVSEVGPPAEAIDELEKLRWNLAVLEAAMRSGAASGMAALSKQHAELVATIHRLETREKPGVSVLDQLAQRRAERLAASAN